MKNIRVICIKEQKIKTNNNVVKLTEQVYHYEGDKIEFSIPDGYMILSITEILPDKFLSLPINKTLS